MIELLPNTTVPRVTGVLSSSTQTYSGSLGTSPKRGFLIRSHLVSADLIATDGSPALGTPRTCFAVEQPNAVTATTRSSARRRTVIVPAIP
ncbi:MAG: hypothetical protein DME00_28660 [Candidatus Rokuibacteriota bacterium]|nr:MAG: hypothetical protein DME00_28660 [Candidatus Rokubacteria bacterium]